MYGFINALSAHSQKINRNSIFEKSKKTIELNRSANRARKKRLPSYFAVATWTSNFILHFYKYSGCVQFKNGVDVVHKYFSLVGEDEWSNCSAER